MIDKIMIFAAKKRIYLHSILVFTAKNLQLQRKSLKHTTMIRINNITHINIINSYDTLIIENM